MSIKVYTFPGFPEILDLELCGPSGSLETSPSPRPLPAPSASREGPAKADPASCRATRSLLWMAPQRRLQEPREP